MTLIRLTNIMPISLYHLVFGRSIGEDLLFSYSTELGVRSPVGKVTVPARGSLL